MKLLFDTNAYTAWKRGHPQMMDLVRRCEHLYLSVIVLGELLHGFRGGSQFERNVRELETFLSDEAVELVEVGRVTSDRYSRIVVQLRREGKPIPTNDIWIAAHAMEHGAELVSFDAHFESVAGLVWLKPSPSGAA